MRIVKDSGECGTVRTIEFLDVYINTCILRFRPFRSDNMYVYAAGTNSTVAVHTAHLCAERAALSILDSVIMNNLSFKIALYVIASGIIFIGLSLLVFEFRQSISISPQVAPAASTFMLVCAIYLISRAHRD